MDTNDGSDGAQKNGSQKNWAMRAALAMVAAGAIAVLYMLFAASSKPETASGLSRFATGEMTRLTVMEAPPPLPARTLQDAAGADVTLSDFRGELLVVNLWATWCPPCIEEMPTLGALQRRFGDRIRVIAISADSEADREKARVQLAQLTDNTLPFYIEISRGVLFDVQTPGMPITIIYDQQGEEVARLAGGADWGSDDAASLIEAVLAGDA